MKNFKTILIVTLILDVLQYIPLIIAQTGGSMQEQMISDMGIEGLAESTAGMAVLDVMMYIFGFIIYNNCSSDLLINSKNSRGTKAATFILFVIHLFWTLPDFINASIRRFTASSFTIHDSDLNTYNWAILCL